jgi:formate dehydrogenase subunit gamma
MTGGTPWDAEAAARIIEKHRHRQGAALPILRALQECFGYVDKAAVPMIAEALNLSKAEVHGIVTFYHDFRSTPVEKTLSRISPPNTASSPTSPALAPHFMSRRFIASAIALCPRRLC